MICGMFYTAEININYNRYLGDLSAETLSANMLFSPVRIHSRERHFKP